MVVSALGDRRGSINFKGSISLPLNSNQYLPRYLVISDPGADIATLFSLTLLDKLEVLRYSNWSID